MLFGYLFLKRRYSRMQIVCPIAFSFPMLGSMILTDCGRTRFVWRNRGYAITTIWNAE